MAFYNSRSDNEDFSDFEGVSTSRTMTPLDAMPQDGWDDSTSIMSGMSHDSEWYGDQITLNGQLTYREDNPETINQVPPLDLRSEMNFSMDSLPDITTHHAKLNQKPCKNKQNTTYELWLQKKLEKQTKDAARRKMEEERREEELNARKRLAEEKYQVWLAKKRQEQPEARSATVPSTTHANATSTSSSTSSAANPSMKSSQKIQIDRNAEKQRKLEAWQRAKREQAEKQRLQKKREEEERLLLEKKRKEESQEAYNRWTKSNKNRPKPVPMNQGLLSLRGTISDIYINPNEWKSILD